MNTQKKKWMTTGPKIFFLGLMSGCGGTPSNAIEKVVPACSKLKTNTCTRYSMNISNPAGNTTEIVKCTNTLTSTYNSLNHKCAATKTSF